MSYKIFSIPPFDSQLKRLSKKYPSLKTEFAELLVNLEAAPKQGSPLGNNCYKIRLSIASKKKGKSGGARIITHVQVLKSEVFLLSIYDKSAKDTISDQELRALLKFIPK
jgi:hypothetical protein